ncbi:flagellar biosynthesis anti-sigma factor FlgM [Helicobacter bizzozeronii]|uniref:flagellar biosynthesis anti-sigma factor FlgM n=1 Tax=Helicobacter bizzozeronii TaxID=56877 RepID=UPI000CEDB2E5|nr:flagellar biosynthesis anti-sigma factor FlgM [Helicobacter bizzozeronii]
MLNSIGNTQPRVSHVTNNSVHENPTPTKSPESSQLQQETHASDKAAQIKKAIEEGNYKVDLDKTSHKMAQDLLS